MIVRFQKVGTWNQLVHALPGKQFQLGIQPQVVPQRGAGGGSRSEAAGRHDRARSEPDHRR